MQRPHTIEQLLKGKQLLIFDFDGTVADTTPLHAAAFEQVLLPLGIAVYYPSIAGMKTEDAMVHSAQSCGRVLSPNQLAALVKAKQATVREMIATRLEPLPGVDDFLRWARQHYRLSMATSGSRGTVSLALEKLRYADWFDPIICSEDVSIAKPHPQAFLTALSQTGYSSAQALVFEDSAAGLEAAKAASIDVVRIEHNSWIEFGEVCGWL